MDSPINCTPEMLEIQRLLALVPEEVRSQISILPSKETALDLITTLRDGPLNYRIQIDFKRWQSFNLDRRNLLFWHEVARLQGQGIRKSSQEFVVLSMGGTALLAELFARNLPGVVTTLAVTGLAGYYLYQRYYGENALRAASAADRNAIQIAMEFGYSFSEAHDSLWGALQTLAQWKSQKFHWRRYRVRLRVLEILNARETSPRQTSRLTSAIPSSHSSLQYQASTLCSSSK
jgi:Protein of unknown function (DUF3318)